MHGGHTKCIVATQNTRHFLLESFVWEEAIHVPFRNRGVSYDWDLSVLYNILYIPFRLNHHYNGEIAHNIFLHLLKATTHVYAHLWGPKTTCHDALEPIRAGGRGPRGPGGPPGGPRAERSFAKNKKCCNIFQKDFLKSTVTQCINTENKGSNPSVSELFCSPFPPRIRSSLKGLR